jgi:prevent-host-death family protein
MSTITASEARATLPALLDMIRGGQSVTITRHGVPAATLSPPHNSTISVSDRDWHAFVAALDQPDTPAQAALRSHQPRWGVPR